MATTLTVDKEVREMINEISKSRKDKKRDDWSANSILRKAIKPIHKKECK